MQALTLRYAVDLIVVTEDSLLPLLRPEDREQALLFLLLRRRIGRFFALLLLVQDVVQILILVHRLVVGRTMAAHVGHAAYLCVQLKSTLHMK